MRKDHGLYFIAFACNLKRIRIQLDRMLGNTDDGYSDHLMRYSTAETGAYWFMPAEAIWKPFLPADLRIAAGAGTGLSWWLRFL